MDISNSILLVWEKVLSWSLCCNLGTTTLLLQLAGADYNVTLPWFWPCPLCLWEIVSEDIAVGHLMVCSLSQDARVRFVLVGGGTGDRRGGIRALKPLSPALTRWDTEVALRGTGVHSAYPARKKVWICWSSISTEFSNKLLQQFIYTVFKTTMDRVKLFWKVSDCMQIYLIQYLSIFRRFTEFMRLLSTVPDTIGMTQKN